MVGKNTKPKRPRRMMVEQLAIPVSVAMLAAQEYLGLAGDKALQAMRDVHAELTYLRNAYVSEKSRPKGAHLIAELNQIRKSATPLVDILSRLSMSGSLFEFPSLTDEAEFQLRRDSLDLDTFAQMLRKLLVNIDSGIAYAGTLGPSDAPATKAAAATLHASIKTALARLYQKHTALKGTAAISAKRSFEKWSMGLIAKPSTAGKKSRSPRK